MAMNRSADPCQDFFQFACGTWNKKHLIPEDRSSISTFEVLSDQLQIILKGTMSRRTLQHEIQSSLSALDIRFAGRGRSPGRQRIYSQSEIILPFLYEYE